VCEREREREGEVGKKGRKNAERGMKVRKMIR
jgi:hypothetical protein